MNFLTKIKTIAGAVVLSAVASVASAATMTFADVSVTGAFEYNEASTTTLGSCPFCVVIPVPANGNANGAVSANLYGDTSVVRNYTLTYALNAMWDGLSGSTSGSVDVPLAFSIDDVLAASGITIGSTPSSSTLTPLGLLTFSGLTVTPTSIDGAAAIFLGGPVFEDLAGLFGLSDDVEGTFDANFALVANVPAVPLPASAPLLLAGLGGMMALRRKRRTAA